MKTISRKKIRAFIIFYFPQINSCGVSLRRRVFHRLHDPRRHVSDQRRRVPHDPRPLRLLPDRGPGLLPLLKVVVAPDVLHVVQLPDFAEKAHESLGVVVVTHSVGKGVK